MKATIRFSLLLVLATNGIIPKAEATISYPFINDSYYITEHFDPPLKQHCLTVVVSDKMKDWSFGAKHYRGVSSKALKDWARKNGYSRALDLTLTFQQDGSIADFKLTRSWGWEDRNAPSIELSSEDFAINYGRFIEDKTSWRLRSFSHRYTDSYATINFGLIIYRSVSFAGAVGDMTEVYLVVFEQRAGQQERIFRSVSSDFVACHS